MQLFLLPLDGVRNGGRPLAAIRTTRHDSSSVEYRGSHRQVSGTHGAEIRACSAVCEWGRNERSQARLNRAPVGFKGLGVLTDSSSVWFGSFEKVKCLCVLLISFGSFASFNSPASSAKLSAETLLIKPSRRHITLSEMIVVLAQISLHGDHHSKWRLTYVGQWNRYLLMWSWSKAGRAWGAKSVICGHRE